MNELSRCRSELQSSDIAQRVAAAETLSGAGSDAAVAAVELVQACADEESVRDWAIAALESMGPPSEESQQQLSDLASDTNPLVAYWAVTLVGRLGTAAKKSEKSLAAVLSNSPDLATRERSAWALGQMEANSEVAVTALKQAAESGEARLSRLATDVLRTIQKT